MIYIFDDKRNRQDGYRWTKEKFMQYADFVNPVYHYSEVQEDSERNKIFSEGNTILFHESFFDADFNRHHKEAIEIRRKLENFAQTHPNFSLVFFSGSKSSRLLNKNVAYLPVSILYQNLDEFIQQTKRGIVDLKYLLYGKKPNIEQELVEKLKYANGNLLRLDEPFNKPEGVKILIATTTTNDRLTQIVTGADYNMNLRGEDEIEIHNVIKTHLHANQYDKIFIPLCYGTSLSDFNGLRLAAHIRCTDTINRYTPVYIYSFVQIDELLNHEYFNILKTKNVQLIDYAVKAFDYVIKLESKPLEIHELPQEMAKLKLEVPMDYEDSHSIANEWAIYRWAKAINTDDHSIQKIIEKVNTQLYFKYLNTIYPTTEMPSISEDELQLKNPGKPKILYVDDDAEKGWYRILCEILSDINSIDQIDYLGDNLKNVTQKEIIDITICKVREDDIDIVILDFRLHPDDFVATNIRDVTGFKLLQNIKKINHGIQVIIFSATTKVWNLQAMQEAGADGFVVKESPELSIDSEFTQKAIDGLIKTISISIKLRFLKTTWTQVVKIKSLPQFNSDSSEEHDEFKLRLNNNLDIAFRLLTEAKYSGKYFNYAYLQFFQIIEDFGNLSFVFKQEDADCYVYVKNKDVLVRKGISDNRIDTAIRFEYGKFVIGTDTITPSKKGRDIWIETNFRISTILIFRLGHENSSHLKWTNIYTKRNKKAAHFGDDNLLTENDIYEILEFIYTIINQNNQNDKNANKGLKKRTYEESINVLKQKHRK
jgi:CheY-like chemotaxis protein